MVEVSLLAQRKVKSSLLDTPPFIYIRRAPTFRRCNGGSTAQNLLSHAGKYMFIALPRVEIGGGKDPTGPL